MKRTLLVPVALVALVASAMLAPAVQAKDDTRIVLRASSAFPGAKGSAKFQTAGQRELEIGTPRVNGLCAARVDRRGANFPAVRAGTRIKVKTAGGALVVSGRF